MIFKPQDALFKAACRSPEHAGPLLRSMLPKAIAAALDWSSLCSANASFIDENLQDSHVDLLFMAELGTAPVYIYLVFEHQSRPDQDMPLRILGCIEQISSRYRDKHPGTNLALVLPCVLTQSLEGWRAPTRFSELLAPELQQNADLRPYIPDFQLIVENLHALSNAELKARCISSFPYLALRLMRDLRYAPGLSSHAHGHRDPLTDHHDLVEAFRELFLSRGGPQAFAELLEYLYRVVDDQRIAAFGAKLCELIPESEATMSTLADKLIQQGCYLGKRASLIRLLGSKFRAPPALIEAKLENCSEFDLDQLLDRVLYAESLEQLFGH